MQTMTLQEFEAQLGATFASLHEPAAWDRYTTRFLTLPEAGKLTSLSRTLSEMTNGAAGSTLVMYSGTGNFPGHENTYLLQVFRAAFGERRNVSEAPVHRFSAQEHNDCWTMIGLCLQNGWDFMLLAGNRNIILWSWHGEFVEVRAAEEGEFYSFRTALSRLGLKEAELGQNAAIEPEHIEMERRLESADHTLQGIEQDNARKDKYARLDQFLIQTRELAQMHRGNLAILERLARSVANTMLEAGEWDEHERRETLLTELRDLAKDNPGDPVVRESLARGICFALKFTGEDRPRASALLDELRQLSIAYPRDAMVRQQLAAGIYGAFPAISQETLLKQSHDLATQYPEDSAVQEMLAVSLHRAIYYAIQDHAFSRINFLLEELRKLGARYPNEAAIHEQLASGITTVISYAGAENPALRESLIRELRTLAENHPGEAAIAGCLADAEAMSQNATR